MIPDDQIKAFQQLYWDIFHEELSLDQARVKAEGLLALVRVILQPLTEERVQLHLQQWREDAPLET